MICFIFAEGVLIKSRHAPSVHGFQVSRNIDRRRVQQDTGLENRQVLSLGFQEALIGAKGLPRDGHPPSGP